MDDTIIRQAAIDAMRRLEQEDIEAYGVKIPEGFDAEPAVEALKALPSAQPEITLESAIDYLHSIGWMQEHDRVLTESAQPERKTGEWIETKHDLYDYFICSECCAGFTDGFQYRYCPNCGANMRTPTQVQLDEADDVMMGGKHGETD